MKLQGPQLSSLFSNNSGTECECVSDCVRLNGNERPRDWTPVFTPDPGNTFVLTCKTDIVITFPPSLIPLGFVTHTRYVNEGGGGIISYKSYYLQILHCKQQQLRIGSEPHIPLTLQKVIVSSLHFPPFISHLQEAKLCFRWGTCVEGLLKS